MTKKQPKQPKQTALGRLVDQYGELSAQIAELEKVKQEIRVLLSNSVQTSAEGELFRVTVSMVRRETMDMEAVRQVLSPEFLAQFTKTTTSVAVRCTAKTGK